MKIETQVDTREWIEDTTEDRRALGLAGEAQVVNQRRCLMEEEMRLARLGQRERKSRRHKMSKTSLMSNFIDFAANAFTMLRYLIYLLL